MIGRRLLCASSLGLLVGVCAAALLSGCGGGGPVPAGPGPQADVTEVGSITVNVEWPDQGGVTTAAIPPATNSIQVELARGGQVIDGGLIVRPDAQMTISGIPVGTADVMATAYPNTDGTGALLAAGNAITDIIQGLNPAVRIALTVLDTPGTTYGFVRDVAGGPLGGALLVTSDGVNLYTGTARSDGLYTMTGVPAGGRVISAALAGYQTGHSAAVVAGSGVQGDFALAALTGDPPFSVPFIKLDRPIVYASAAAVRPANGAGGPYATIVGQIEELDSGHAALVHNGEEALVAAPSGGVVTEVALVTGTNLIQVRATNAKGTTISKTITIEIGNPG